MPAIDQTLAALGITLPAAPKPVAAYVPWVRSGNLVFISGQLPTRDGKLLFTGKIGDGALSIDDGAAAARACALNALAVLKDACEGNLDRVSRIVRLGLFVASTDAFTAQSKVANGASDFFVDIFHDKGKHARAAVGVNTLPLGAPVELELLAQIND